MLDGWAETLGVASTLGPLQRVEEVSRLLGLFCSQLRLVAAGAVAADLSEALYRPPLDVLEQMTSPDRFQRAWKDVAGALSRHASPLTWAAEVLPADGQAVSDGELDDVRQMAEGLLQELARLPADSPLRALAEEQVGIILRAIREYFVVGTVAFETAAKAGAASLFVHRHFPQQNGTAGGSEPSARAGIMARLDALWARVAKLGERMAHTEHLIESGIRLLGAASDAARNL